MEIPKPNQASPPGSAAPITPIPSIAQPARGISALATKYGGRKVRPATAEEDDRTDLVWTGVKDGSKSSALVGIPVKKGKRHFLSFDKRTREGLVNYYGKGVLKDNLVYQLVTPDDSTGYPGFDPNKSWTAEEVMGNTMAILEDIEKAGDGDVIILDHGERIWTDIGRSLVIHKAGLDPATDTIPYQMWGPRSANMNSIMAKASSIAKVAAIITGYALSEELVMVEKTPEEIAAEKRAGRGGGKTKLVRKVETPRWLEAVLRDQSVWIHSTSTKESEGTGEKKTTYDRYWAEVMASKNELFPKGVTVEITNTNASVFYEKPGPSVLQEARMKMQIDRDSRMGGSPSHE